MSYARPSSHPDLLAGATLSSLTRPIYFPLSWGVLPSFLANALTLGILPNILLTRWLPGVIGQHEQQVAHLTVWLSLHFGSTEAAEVIDRSRIFGVDRKLDFGAKFCTLIALLAAYMNLRGALMGQELHWSLGLPWTNTIWIGILGTAVCAAAVFNFLQMIKHQRAWSGYIGAFNRFAGKHGLDPINVLAPELGHKLIWVLAALGSAASGAIWAIPVMLAMGAHRRYTMVTSVRLRAQLAERMRILLDRETPPLTVPRDPVTVLRTCIRPNCRAPLTFAAAFCPRCGTTIARSVDVVG